MRIKRILSLALTMVLTVGMLPPVRATSVQIEYINEMDTMPAAASTENLGESAVEENVESQKFVPESGELEVVSVEAEEPVLEETVVIEAEYAAEQQKMRSSLDLQEQATAQSEEKDLYIEKEPNNYFDDANVIYHEMNVYGTLSPADRGDVYRIDLEYASYVVVAALAEYSSFRMELYDDTGKRVLKAEYDGKRNDKHLFSIYERQQSGTYFLKITDDDEYYNEYTFQALLYPYGSSCHHDNVSSIVTPPTCTAQGYTTYTCKDCGESWKNDYTKPNNNHTDYRGVEVEGTCTKAGYIQYTCKACGSSWPGEYTDINEFNHVNYTTKVTEPTCYTKGYTDCKCRDCGKTWKENFTEPTNHSNNTGVVTEPDCIHGGYTTYTCKDCDYVWKDDFTKATGIHTYLHDGDVSCENCSFIRIEGFPSGSCGNDLTWVLDSEYTLTIFGTGAMDPYIANRAPWSDYQRQIRQVLIRKGVTSVGAGAFAGCSELISVSIPEGVAEIGQIAFSWCSKLRDAVLPESLEIIGSEAFSNCGLQGILTIPAKVKQIGKRAFQGCAVLQGLKVDSKNSMYSSNGDNILFDKEKTTLIWAPGILSGDYEIPDSVVTIAEAAFSENGNLTGVTIHSGVVKIGANAFENCTSLAYIVFLGDAPEMDANAFAGVTAEARFPSGNTTWRDGICQNYGGDLTWGPLCMEDHEAVPGACVAPTCGAQGYTNYSCKNCAHTWKADYVNATGEHTFEAGQSRICAICGYDDRYEAVSGSCNAKVTWVLDRDDVLTIYGSGSMQPGFLQEQVPWKAHLDRIRVVVVNNGITAISRSAFSGCTALMSVTLPESLEQIDDGAFSGCTSLTSVNIPKKVTTIGDFAFQDCSSLAAVTLPEGVTEIGMAAFRNCSSLTGIAFPGSIAAIGKNAFRDCTSLSSLALPEGITVISAGLFYGCRNLVSVNIPETVTTIGESAFQDCKSLTSLWIPKNVDTIWSAAFSGCSSLKTIVFCTSLLMYPNACTGVTATVYYTQNSKWSSELMRNYGGYLDWQLLCKEGHQETVLEERAATCAQDGLTEGTYCSVCTDILIPQEKIPRLEHTEAIAAYKTPTCTEPGLTEGKYCSVCGGILEAQTEIPATGHSKVVDPYSNPTCTEAGMTEGSHCGQCGIILEEQKTLQALGHHEVDSAVVEATCNSTGQMGGTHCAMCKEILTPPEVIPYLPHTETLTSAIAPSCNAAGLTEGTHCAVCNEILTPQEVIPVLPHTEAFVPSEEPSCTETGWTEGSYCAVCNEILVPQEEIPMLPHTAVIDPYKAPTCTENGLTEGSHCEICGAELVAQTEIAASHTEKEEPYLAPTCLTAGMTAGSSCSVCGEVLVVREAIPMLPHTEQILPYRDPTCSEVGLTEGKYCSACSTVLVPQEEIPMLPHTEVIDPYMAPCCQEGLTEGSHCSVCKEILVPQEKIPALGHQAVTDPERAPSCEETGLTEGSHCDVCQEVLVPQQIIPKTKHSYIQTGNEAVCPACGHRLRLQLNQEYIALDLQRVTGGALQLEIEPADLDGSVLWSLEAGGEAVAAVDETGFVTARGVGTAYVLATYSYENMTFTARCRVDVAEKSQVTGVRLGAQKVTLELFSRDYVQIPVLLQLPQNAGANVRGKNPQPGSMTLESARFAREELNWMFRLVTTDDRNLMVVPTEFALENPGEAKGSLQSTVIVTVDGMEYTLETLTLTVKQTKPKLKASISAFNSFLSGQSQEIRITGGTVTAIRENPAKAEPIPEWLKLEEGCLTLRPDAPMKNLSGKAHLLVETREWAIPAEITLSVKNSYKAPSLKLSASTVTISDRQTHDNGIPMKLLPGSKKETLASLNVVELITGGGYNVENWNPQDGSFLLKVPEGAGAEKLQLLVRFAHTDNWLPLQLTVKTAPVKLKLEQSSLTLNKAAEDSAVVQVTATPADYRVELTEADLRLTDSTGKQDRTGELDILPQGNTITVKPTVAASGSYKLFVRSGGSKEVALTIKITDAAPSVTFKVKNGIDLTFPEQGTVITPTFKNYNGSFKVAEMEASSKELPDAAQNFRLEQIGQNLLLRCNGETVTGNYTLTLKLTLADGSSCENTVKIAVNRTPVKLKLSESKLTLNKAIGEVGYVDVNCVTKGYALGTPVTTLMDKTGKNSAAGELDIRFENGKLRVAVNENTDFGATYKLLVRADDKAPAQTLTVSVPIEAKSIVTASLKLTGKLDVIRPGSIVTAIPVYKNCLSATKKEERLRIFCSDADVTHLFVVTPDGKDGYSIARAEGAALTAGEPYRVELVSTLGGMELAAASATFKPTIGSAKVTLETKNTILFAQDKQDRITFQILPKDTAMAETVKVEIKDDKYRDVFEIYSYGDGEFALGYQNGQVPETLIGKTVTVNLNLFLEGNQTQKPNAAAKLKLTILE